MLVLYQIGFLGPLILFCLTVYLAPRPYVYALFFVANSVLNEGLKYLLHESRPPRGKTIMNEPTDPYGMPSGHAQSVFFSLAFLWLVRSPLPFIVLALGVALLTVYQRWKYRQHTLAQLGAGSFLGILWAFVAANY